MMRFFRELRGYIARPNEIAAVRTERLKFSFFVQLHIFVAFFVTVSMIGGVVAGVRTLGDEAMKLPQGVEFVKTGAELSVTGLAQPFSFGENDGVVTIDTTGSILERPASSTIFIGKTFIEMAPTGDQAGQRMLWSEGEDFSVALDKFRTVFFEQESTFVTLLTILLFVYFLLSSLVFSGLIILIWSVLVAVATRFVSSLKPMVLRDVAAMHLVAISGPLIFWAVFIMSGVGGGLGVVVEIFSFVVYSVLGLYVAQGVFDPPSAGSSEGKSEIEK